MDFFQHQQQAKKRTVFLVVMYCLGVTALVGGVGAVLFFCAASSGGINQESIIGIITGCGIVFLIITGASLFKSTQLANGGGKAVAESLGGRRIDPNTRDLYERRLYNVVEEMALAGGVPIPTIYIMDNEHSINAFAAGFSSNAAVIGCNRGTVELLSRDELQGVIAHEFSHILNGDMRMNIRLIGILFGLQVLALVGYYVMYFGSYLPRTSNNRNDKGASAGIGLAMILGGLVVMIFGYIGVFFSALIQSAISRQREFLADASAVQFTRNPSGIAGALRKIGCPKVGSQMQSPGAAEASHLFFGNACGMFSFGELLVTHPPLPIRIKRIDPTFDGKFPAEIYPINIGMEAQNSKSVKNTPAPPKMPFPMPYPGVSALSPESVGVAAAVISQIPQGLSEPANNSVGAIATFFALLLDANQDIRNQQLASIPNKELLKETLRQYPQVRDLADNLKLPLAQRISSSLRAMSPDQYTQFVAVIDKLIAADNKMDLFEYSLKAVLLRDLDIYFGLTKQLSVRYTSLSAVQNETVAVLSFLAYSGHNNLKDAEGAFFAAAKKLTLPSAPLHPQQATIQLFDQGLRKLAETAPALKKQIWEAFQTCVKYDGQQTQKESELLRAIAAMLAIPLPL